MKKQIFSLAILMIGILSMPSCKKHDHNHDEELITTMRLTFIPTSGGTPLIYQFDDPDGPGGMAPSQDQIVLAASTSYNVSIQLLNKSVTPHEDITGEVSSLATMHRFYFAPSAGSNINVTNLSTDSRGMPFGLTSVWTTGTSATGNIRVTLRHYSNTTSKAADDPVNSTKASTDIEVLFDTVVQ